jgi:hypothetical protein
VSIRDISICAFINDVTTPPHELRAFSLGALQRFINFLPEELYGILSSDMACCEKVAMIKSSNNGMRGKVFFSWVSIFEPIFNSLSELLIYIDLDRF